MVQVMVCNSLSGFEVGNIFLILIVNNFSTFSELMIFHSIWQNIYIVQICTYLYTLHSVQPWKVWHGTGDSSQIALKFNQPLFPASHYIAILLLVYSSSMVLLQSMKNFFNWGKKKFFFGKVRWYIRENEYDMLEKYLFILYVGICCIVLALLGFKTA